MFPLPTSRISLLLLAFVATIPLAARAQSALDVIGATALRNEDSSLTGSGVLVYQVESAPNPAQFEVNPSSVGQPAALFSWRSSAGPATSFPNHIGSESGHADQVAQNFYGQGTGVAPGLRHVTVWQTNYFYPNVIQALVSSTARIVNQSFEFGSHNAGQDAAYDNYIARNHTLISSGVGNGGAILTPADCFNGLGVGAFNGSSSTGPTADGRCKPDLVAPAGATSFSTPLVSGAGAILLQGARRQGINANAAADSRTLKALLINGAVKPNGWSHSDTVPLDHTFGAGVLNIFNSYHELAGGRHAPAALTDPTFQQAHPPLVGGAAGGQLRGWDYRALTSTGGRDACAHYRFTSNGGNLVATLVWNRGFNAGQLNRIYLYLYDGSGQLVASSHSKVDNVQQLYLNLGAGTYELEVVKQGGTPGTSGVYSDRELYALAWDFTR